MQHCVSGYFVQNIFCMSIIRLKTQRLRCCCKKARHLRMKSVFAVFKSIEFKSLNMGTVHKKHHRFLWVTPLLEQNWMKKTDNLCKARLYHVWRHKGLFKQNKCSKRMSCFQFIRPHFVPKWKAFHWDFSFLLQGLTNTASDNQQMKNLNWKKRTLRGLQSTLTFSPKLSWDVFQKPVFVWCFTKIKTKFWNMCWCIETIFIHARCKWYF